MPRRKPKSGPGPVVRGLAGLAGLVLGASALIGLWRALQSGGQTSPFASLALLLPTALLARYALTGKIKVS